MALYLHDITWPDNEECAKIAGCIEEQYGFLFVVGFMDSTKAKIQSVLPQVPQPSIL
ncbi:hypothetical protein AMAG_09564 [Allomyces macrogynus ATCC 38327]|uniref:Uncharacterized protein n=1 Tax=Allomyces macrogynus (strain ATCC 38327) TaxID=578462 RepID=A0A0L0STB7_ALLM3|nr:hypothetical protein AMAG_09564 [Allomyces macrogynus ATCC 38327]|eukprot:KNE65584.1 hypothetical protein AMAG_09564 [Allomyces macrogynus ATCC 38327]